MSMRHREINSGLGRVAWAYYATLNANFDDVRIRSVVSCFDYYVGLRRLYQLHLKFNNSSIAASSPGLRYPSLGRSASRLRAN